MQAVGFSGHCSGFAAAVPAEHQHVRLWKTQRALDAISTRYAIVLCRSSYHRPPTPRGT